MKIWFLCCVTLFVQTEAWSQVKEEFNDSALGPNPEWEGMLSSFAIVTGELRSDHAVLNSMFYISTPVKPGLEEWRLDCRLLFNTSSVNYVDYLLLSDSMNLLKAKNGYFIRMGGSTDEISLYKLKNGLETKLIDGLDGFLNTSVNRFSIVLQRLNDSFVLKHQKPGGQMFREGSVKDPESLDSGYAGIRIRQSTASFINRHFFDNLYIGPLLKDTIPPVCDSIRVIDHKRLKCYMNEPCDSISICNTSNYVLLNSFAAPVKAWIEQGGSMVTLEFDASFIPNKPLNLKLAGIIDKAGHKMQEQVKGFYYSRPDTPGLYELVITEIFADTDPQVGLPPNEYVEITNVSGKFINLKGTAIHDATSFNSLPNLVLPPDSVLMLTAIPSLNNAGDRLWLVNQSGRIIHMVNYSDKWYDDEIKKAGGYSLEMIDYSQPCLGLHNWTASKSISGGTPGQLNSVKGNIVKDVSGPVLRYFAVEPDSLLVLYFDEAVDSSSVFSASFSVNGNAVDFKVWNMSSDGDVITFICPFKPDRKLVYNIAFSGIKDCSGNVSGAQVLELQWPSLSLPGQLLINEILFNPRSGGSDFVELYNNSSLAFDLSEHYLAGLDASGSIKDKIPAGPKGAILKPFHYALISEDTVNICLEYDCKASPLKLQPGGLPSMPDDHGTLVLMDKNSHTIDSLYYTEDWHFPLIKDKSGVSLERLNFELSSGQSGNWYSASSVSGYATPGYRNSQSFMSVAGDKFFRLSSPSFSPDQDGFEDRMILEYTLPGPDFVASAHVYDLEGRLIRQLLNNSTLGTEGLLTWDGTDSDSQKAPIAIYVLWIECFNPEGRIIREKMSVVLAGRL